jgi:O-antigen ligase
VLLAAWTVLTVLSGGIDLGDGLATRGATAAMLATLVAAPFAAWALMRSRDRAAPRSGPALLAIGGVAGLAVWAGISILWAPAGDLAWTEANRIALAALALMIGIGIASMVPQAPERFAVGLSIAAAPVVLWALLARCMPTVFGSDFEPSRLQAPVGYWNALALVAVVAIPGLLWWAARRGGDHRDLMGAAAAITVAVTTLVLTYSRGGLLSLVLVCLIVVGIMPGRMRQLSALAGGLIGAILPAWYGLTTDALTDDALIAADRSDAGLGLLWRLLVGLAIAAAVAWAIQRVLGGGRLTRRRAGVAALVVVLLGVTVAGAYALAKPRDVGAWISARTAEVTGTSGGLANTPGRLGSLDTNQRLQWWGEAARSAGDNLLVGEGAGSFPLVHLRERTTGEDRLNVRQPHNLVLEIASGLGLVGLALLGCLVAGVAWAGARAWQRRGPPTIALPLAVFAAFLLQSQLDWTWTVPALTTVAMAAAGVMIAAAAPGPAPPGRTVPRPVVAGAWALAPIIMLSALIPWWSQEKVAQGNQAISAGQPAVAEERAQEASDLNPLAIQPWLLRGRAAALLDDPAGMRAAAQRATRVQPGNPAGWALLAVAYGDTPEGLAAWRQVLVLSPNDARARLALEAIE